MSTRSLTHIREKDGRTDVDLTLNRLMEKRRGYRDQHHWVTARAIPSGTFVVFDKPPRPKSIVQPRYPGIARQAELEGTVRCLVTVGPRGNVLRVVVEWSDAEVFNRSAVEALEQWTWYPAEQSGNPVRATVVVPYRFSLNR